MDFNVRIAAESANTTQGITQWNKIIRVNTEELIYKFECLIRKEV